MKETLISNFCEVGVLCAYGQPNWLGWIVIGFASVWMLSLLVTIAVEL